MSKVNGKRLGRGFTLIELLVVVAIIAVLLAVLLPSLGRAKQIARVIICRSHLKNIPAACQMYLDDWNGRFLHGPNRNFTYGGWDGRLAPVERPFNPYLDMPAVGATASDAKVFKCPGDNGRYERLDKVIFDEEGNSYQANVLLIGPDKLRDGTFAFPPALLGKLNERLEKLNISQVTHPSQVILAGDSAWVDQWDQSTSDEGVVWHYRPAYFCVAFLDSHVEYLQIPKGVLCGPGYCVLPFADLCSLAPPPPPPPAPGP